MQQDRHGNTLPGATADAARLFDEAVDAFNAYRGDPVALADRALAEAPRFPMALALKAYLHALATEPAATDAAAGMVADLKTMDLDEREASHVAALEALVAGAWTEAAHRLDRHTMAFPRDMVALQAGHLADFYRASARGLRDRIARALPAWPADMPGRSFLLGMLAFGLEETGDYRRAEEAGRQAVDDDPRDCWAHHAVAHVLEMEGRPEEGIGWMIAREPHWAGDDNFFQVHNWWHRALYHLDLGQDADALALFDGRIGRPSEMALDLVDQAALLWRLHLAGVDVGDRWGPVADAWSLHADGRLYPFNDWHAAMAFLGAGREAEVDRILAAYRAGTGETETARWAVATGLPLIEGFRAFWHGDHATAVERLLTARPIVNTFGGSHAQRDVIDWTLTEAAIRGRLAGVAEALANERLALKPHSPLNRGFLARARARAGAGMGPTAQPGQPMEPAASLP